jgi:hypothetical protein
MLTVIATGALTRDPTGNERYTMFKLRVLGSEITLFNQISAAESRADYRSGMRIRGEGRGEWKEFSDEYTLQVNACGIDGSDAEDELTIKVDGRINHELILEKDAEDEGGGRYIPVEIEAPVRGRDRQGNWGDLIAYVRAHVLDQAVDQLLKLDKEGVTNIRFTGRLQAHPEYLRDEPIYYAEITKVEPSQGRGGGNDDAFWSSKPKGLGKRKSGPVKPASPAKKRGGGGGGASGGGELNDEMPF